MDAAKLARMANQIAANFDYGPDKSKAAAGAADHLRRFWNPVMLDELIEYHAKGEAGLSAIAAIAIKQIAEERRAAR